MQQHKFLIEHLQKLAGITIKEQEIPDNQNKRKIFVLVGPPSTGKSTWISTTFSNTDNQPYIINRDDIAEAVAQSNSWSYDEMFVTPPANANIGDIDEKYGKVIPAPNWMPWTKTVFSRIQGANGKVQHLFEERVNGAVDSGKDIVVDMTNMTSGARKAALRTIKGAENEFEKIAVVFQFHGAEGIIKKISAKRAEAAKRMGKSKTIPDAAFERMFSSFQEVKTSEGFDKILSVDNRAAFKKIVEESLQLEQAGIPPTSSPPQAPPQRKKFSQQQPVAQQVNLDTVEGREALMKDFIATSKEMMRAIKTVEIGLQKITSKDNSETGVTPFIHDIATYVEPNMARLRDTVPTAWDQLKKATGAAVNLAKQQKAIRDSQPTPQPTQQQPQQQQTAHESAWNKNDFTKKSLKEVFDWSEE